MGETATRTVRLSPSRPGGEGCHEGTGDRHMDPDCPCSLLIRVIPPGCPTGRLWGIFTGQCSMELWPVNCAIRCRLARRWNHAGSIGCEVAKCGSLALCLHYGPRFGPCTFSLDGGALTRLITLSLCSGSSTPGSALLPYGFGSAGRCRSCCYTDPVTGQRASCLRELSPTRYG